MLEVNDIKYGDILVLLNDKVSISNGKLYKKGTEFEVIRTKHTGTHGKALLLSLLELRYPDGRLVSIEGAENIENLVASKFEKKTSNNVDLKIGDVFSVTETLCFRICSKIINRDAVEVRVTGLHENNVNYIVIDVHGTKYPHSSPVCAFINNIALKSVKLRNEGKKDIKLIDIYSDRKTLQVGDIVVSTGKFADTPYLAKAGVYGKIVESDPFKDGYFVCSFEEPLNEEFSFLKQHTISGNVAEVGLFKIVTHRDVPEDFVPYKVIKKVNTVQTQDLVGVVGKVYTTQNPDGGWVDLICTESAKCPHMIVKDTMEYFGEVGMNFLYEDVEVNKNIPLPPTAQVKL